MKMHCTQESWPLREVFAISRGSKTHAQTVTVTLTQDGHSGHGECVPYARYGETIADTLAALEAARAHIGPNLQAADIPALLAPMSARNALDCALFDLNAKRSGQRAWQLAGLAGPVQPLTTAFTLSLGSVEAMTEAATRASTRPLLKVKMGSADDGPKLRAVRHAAPLARLVVDANEGWSPENFAANMALCAKLGVELIEQPLPAVADETLRHMARPVPVCADESCHGIESLKDLVGKYDVVNIKLDKTGGIVPALVLAREATARGLGIMAGCMVASSLSMAPAMLIGQMARVVDLDGPLLLAHDRVPGIDYQASLMLAPPPALWG